MASGSNTSLTNEIDLPADDVTDKQSLLRTLIRYIMRTFYDLPLSLIVEYIYYHKCINLEQLSNLLNLNPKQVQSYIQTLKRNKFIIEEDRRESNIDLKSKFDPKTLYYTIDIATLINGIKYRLITMKLEIEDFERKEQIESTIYKCEQCSKEYIEFDLARLFQNSLGEDISCTQCHGRIEEPEQQPIRCDMRLFNEEMKVLFQILEKIDQIMKIEQSTMVNNDDKYFPNMNTNDAMNSNEKILVKPLPEWFTRSSVYPEPDQSDS